MLRLIGAIVVVLLLLGPLLLHAGLLEHVPLLRDFVLLEIHAFDVMVGAIRNLFGAHGQPHRG